MRLRVESYKFGLVVIKVSLLRGRRQWSNQVKSWSLYVFGSRSVLNNLREEIMYKK